MLSTAVVVLVLGWLPGAIIYRAPFFERDRRAGLAPEERAFWMVIVSLAVSLLFTMALAIAEHYTIGRLLTANALLSVSVALASRCQLSFAGRAAPLTVVSLVPVLLLLLMAVRAVPPSEYIIGGKDPGIYMNEGIQMAQRGSLVTRDDVVAAVPASLRDLFFPSHQNPNYYSLRFMGFFIQDPERGTVVGQFPHLFPASVAIAYGIDGLTGARHAPAVWAVLGVVGLYLLGARIVGHAPAALAAILLALHLLQVWYARYPNSEIMMQALLLAGVLAADRALEQGDRFFGLTAGLLLGMQWTLRFDVALAIAAVAAAVALGVLKGRRLPWSLLVPLTVLSAAGLAYLATLMTGYSYYPLGFTRDWVLVPGLVAALTGLALLLWTARSARRSARVQRAIPVLLIVYAVGAVAYAWFLREPRGRTAAYDAFALRTFAQVYLLPAGLVAAVAGFAYVVSTRFWRAPVFLLTTTAFATFFFYKVRVVPEHFWMGRRFLAVILPAALLFMATIALSGLHAHARWRRALTTSLGAAFLFLVGLRYTEASRPVIQHVEYRDIIPNIEKLARQVADDDLVVLESRDTSEVHVLALPLAYVYARNVLVLANPVPDEATFEGFLEWARTKYARVLFMGGGGTDLISTQWTAARRDHVRFGVAEYDHTAWNAYPRGPREKVFDFSVYELSGAAATPPDRFDLDVGGADDLHLLRFYIREQTEGRWIRWTGRRSFVTIPALPTSPKTMTLWMSDGGRPPGTPPVRVSFMIDDVTFAEATVATGFRAYSFDIPPEIARTIAARKTRLTITANPWNPHDALGTGDDRELGVMVDRVRIE